MNRLGLTSRIAFLGSTAVIAATLASGANAQVQEQTPPQANQSATDEDNAEIVITAQKREEKILDIPQSVTVVGGDTLERQHAATFEDYLNEIPGLSLSQDEPGETRLVLRGVNTGGVSSTVAVYVDETPFGSSTALVNGAILAGDFDPFDLARIEVLRGPQGTLYGANSLGGIFKFVTNKPQLGVLSGRARAGVEFVDDGGTGYNVNGMINVPLGDTVAFRASGTFRKDAGWVDADPQDIVFPGINIPPVLVIPDLTVTSLDDNNINDNKLLNGRASVLFQPTEQLTIRLTAHGQNMRTHSSAGVEVDDDYDPVRGDFSQTVFIPEFNDIDYRVLSSEIEYDFGFASLLSATSYGKLKSSFRSDVTLLLGGTLNLLFGPQHSPLVSPFPHLTDEPLGSFQDQVTRVNKFTQEFRLASPSNDAFEWMVGLYYTHEDGLIDQHINGGTLADPGDQLGDDLHDLLFLSLDSRYKELAGFANVTWHATDRFDITAGARLSRNDQHSEQVVGGPLAPLQFPGGIPIFEPGNSDESVFTYSVSPRYELSDTTAIYARIAKGYRPGGPNAVPPLSEEDLANFPTTFDADTLTSYELGLKTDIGRRVSVDLAAYHLDWNNIQVLGTTGIFSYNDNGGGARVNGLEGTVTLRPIQGLRTSFNAALIDAELTDDTPLLVGGLDGDTLPFTPKVSFGLNADYEWKVTSSTTAFVGGSVRYSGEQRGDFNAGGAPQRHIPDYATLDLRAGAEFGQFTLEAYARNVTNARGITNVGDGLPLPGGAISAAVIQPRTIGLSLTAGF